jgi:hypothetical protein
MRDVEGRHLWVVVLKATFDIDERGTLRPSDEQPLPRYEPEHRGDPATTSLLAEADLVPLRPGTDVVVIGHAHAPRGRPAKEVPVALRLAGIDKTLIVRGERVYANGPLGVMPSSPVDFTIKPIEYERAFGGADVSDPDPSRHRIDLRNPVGRGFAVQASRLEGTPAPNIEYPQGDPARVGPAGFGPIASHWSPRRELAGTYDAAWLKQRSPLLPRDFDPRFHLCSPADQRIREPLRGGERLELVHMTPSGVLRCDLPRLESKFTTYFGRRKQECPASLVSVSVEADAPRLSLAWQMQLVVGPNDVERLDRTIVDARTRMP